MLEDYPHTVLRVCSNGSEIGFQQGNFDNWCVYYSDAKGNAHFYRDYEYFTTMRCLNNLYGKVYDDFYDVYKWSSKQVDDAVFDLILGQSLRYGEHRWLYENEMSVIYMGMIAEENKDRSIIGNRMKLLGMYQTLKLGWNPKRASDFSRNMRWRDIRELMRGYGIWEDRDTDPV